MSNAGAEDVAPGRRRRRSIFRPETADPEPSPAWGLPRESEHADDDAAGAETRGTSG